MQKPASVRYPARYRTANWAILSGLVWLISIQGIRAQSPAERLLKGVVRAKDGDVLPGSNVVFKGQTRGTSTDGNGSFSLDVKAGDVLVISAIGYQSTEVTVGNQPSITVTLNESASQLNEVVVVGYGTQDRKDLVGAVSQVNADEIKNRPVASFDQQLQGRAAGVQVAANTGLPGDGIFFRIRGTTSINASRSGRPNYSQR